MSRRPTRALAAALAVAAPALLLASSNAPNASAHDTRTTWPYATLVQRISGKPLTLPDRQIRIDRDLVICNGEGKPIRRGGAARWKHFTCTQTLLAPDGVGRDITFRVHVLTRTRFLITNVRYGPD